MGSSTKSTWFRCANRESSCCGRCHTKSQRRWLWTMMGASAFTAGLVASGLGKVRRVEGHDRHRASARAARDGIGQTACRGGTMRLSENTMISSTWSTKQPMPIMASRAFASATNTYHCTPSYAVSRRDDVQRNAGVAMFESERPVIPERITGRAHTSIDRRSAHALSPVRLGGGDVCARVEDLAPLGDDLLVSHSDRSDTSAKIVHPHGVQVVALIAQRVLPVDLVGERIPGEPHDRNSCRTHREDVRPLRVQPLHREMAHAVRLAVEDRHPIALMVLRGQPPEAHRQGARARAATGGRDTVLARRIVVDAEPALPDRTPLAEEAHVVRRDAMIVEIARHAGRQLVPHRQVEREMLQPIEPVRLVLRVAAPRLEVLDRLALHDDRVRTLGQDRLDRQLVRHAQVADRAHERLVALLALVPPALAGGEVGRDEDLVDGCEVLDPRIPAREGTRVLGEQHRESGILKAPEPRRDAEVTQIGDDGDPEVAQPLHLGVAHIPVVAVRGGVHPVVRWAVAQRVEPGLAHEREVLLPAGVVPAFVHLIYAYAASDRWIAVLNARGEEERSRRHIVSKQRIWWLARRRDVISKGTWPRGSHASMRDEMLEDERCGTTPQQASTAKRCRRCAHAPSGSWSYPAARRGSRVRAPDDQRRVSSSPPRARRTTPRRARAAAPGRTVSRTRAPGSGQPRRARTPRPRRWRIPPTRRR